MFSVLTCFLQELNCHTKNTIVPTVKNFFLPHDLGYLFYNNNSAIISPSALLIPTLQRTIQKSIRDAIMVVIPNQKVSTMQLILCMFLSFPGCFPEELSSDIPPLPRTFCWAKVTLSTAIRATSTSAVLAINSKAFSAVSSKGSKSEK